ncbi:tannase/feruloyl esterase family alpha/beta hydrolase [Sphingobium nicotianae]|uniref:Tannase/feruloyl esterase family alpha/beta hydrolase n=1 Tax=Sphingobium nicotianae TaxID=2782607 RepID=A0A9X1DBI3_9SPHN|nr:tannase/feruloyl esterase family alpha/beta hydrolase [Sphingobium nicotianae]MBT2187007.1 tannase/feruloyl esterase family alpha/beta hydrolase [Sphingobium nicotianae]
MPKKLIALALLVGTAALPGAAHAQDKCTALANQAFGADVRISAAVHVAAGPMALPAAPGQAAQSIPLPGHCKVEGIINDRTGKDGKRYGIGFALALPDDWNGRFLLMGGGGLNGSVAPPIGPVAAGGTPALARGFAVLSHDSGHKGPVFDNSFMADQRATLDFAETSVRTVALLGKQISATYYGRPVAHSYMTGCSTGGREGMLASQRYPELFDGIIVGAPAMRTGDSNLGVEFTTVLFNQAAPRDKDGKPILAQVLTAADRKTILDGLLAQCDGIDGLKDGMIEAVAQCRFDARLLQCKRGKQDGCLSAGQVNALVEGFKGPKDKAGYPIYAPVPYDTGIVATPMGYLPSGIPGPLGPPSQATSIDLDARIHDIRNNAQQRLTDTNYWTNLNTYLDRGGKIIFYHGVSDFWFSPFATWDYYERAAKDNGKAFTDASRFYMVPGMLHCAGGNSFDQFDMLSSLVDWVETGKAPEAITASRRGPDPDQRPLCPYPSYARYTGGDEKRAGSFACSKPAG